MVSYNKLWKLLIDKGLNKKELIDFSCISSSLVAKCNHRCPMQNS